LDNDFRQVQGGGYGPPSRAGPVPVRYGWSGAGPVGMAVPVGTGTTT